jgi:DnaD/phage-associated family protein
MDNAGQNGATHAGNAGQYGDVQDDVSSGEASYEGEDEAGYDHHYPQFEADSDPGYRYMVTAAESYLGRTLTPTDIALFDRLHKEYDFSYELIEYLVELCVELGKKSNRYMETVALSWVKEGKLSVAELKEERKAFRKENRAVMKAFGITGRMLGDKERSYVDKWLKEQHFTLDVIIEACDHTMTAIKSPSFEYTDTILTSWKKAGVATVEDARRVSEEFKNAAALKHGKGGRGQSSRGGSSGTAGAPNRFHNFEQRNIDYDALLADEIGLKKRKKTKQKDNEKDEAAGAQQAGQKAEPSGEMAELFGQEDTEARRLWKPDKHLSESESC